MVNVSKIKDKRRKTKDYKEQVKNMRMKADRSRILIFKAIN